MAKGTVAAAVATAALLLVLTAAPGVLTGQQLIGNATADIWGHTWGYWWAADALSHGRIPFDGAPLNWPAGTRWLLVDIPVAVVLVPVTWLFGAVAAYHASLLGHAALLAAGVAWWLGRRGAPTAVAVGCGLLAGAGPFARGALASGTPETLAVAWLPWLAGTMEVGLGGSRRSLAVAGALAGLMCLDGFYAALSGGIVGVVVLVGGLRRHGAIALVRGMVVGAPAAAAVLLLRAGLVASEHPALSAAPREAADAMASQRWVVASPEGADLLNLFAPALLLPQPDVTVLHRHTVFVGVALVIAALAAWRRGGRGWLVAAAIAMVLCLGPGLQVAGRHVSGVVMPAAALRAVGAHNAWRVGGVAMLGLVLASGLWWSDLWQRRRWLAAGWMVAAGLEGLLLAPIEVRMPTTANPAGPLEQWLAEHPGPVVDLPFDRDPLRPPGPRPQQSLILQVAHGQPIASGRGALPVVRSRNATIQALDTVVVNAWRNTDVHYRDPWPPGGNPYPDVQEVVLRLRPLPPSAEADRDKLVADGFVHLTLDRALLPLPARDAFEQRLTDWLGEPVRREGERLVWELGG